MFQSTSRLGFGCAELLTRSDRSTAERLLEFALDEGVSHFDVARSYEDGRAESALGALARRRRGEMTIVTKAGIEPPNWSARVRRRFRFAVSAPARADFSPSRLRKSVETSLRALALAHVDVLMLHECSPCDVTDDVVRLLEALQWEGKAGALGVATSGAYAKGIVERWPDVFSVVQTSYADGPRALGGDVARIVHSVLKHRADGEPALTAISRAMDAADVVLFSSCSFQHIRANAMLGASRGGRIRRESSDATPQARDCEAPALSARPQV